MLVMLVMLIHHRSASGSNSLPINSLPLVKHATREWELRPRIISRCFRREDIGPKRKVMQLRKTCPRQSLTVNIHCEFSSRFHSDSMRIRSGFVSKRRESPRIHNVFAQQYGFANFGRVFTVIHCETLSWVQTT